MLSWSCHGQLRTRSLHNPRLMYALLLACTIAANFLKMMMKPGMKLGAIVATAIVGIHADESVNETPPAINPFWLAPQLQMGMEFRPTDTIISVPAKSGTTWTMNIFHQLRTGGDPDFVDLYAEVPWMEFKERPDQTDEELYTRWRNLPKDVPRAFKTHSAPPLPGGPPFLPYREDLKYIVVFRNPEEAMVSFLPFLKGHRQEMWDYFNAGMVKAAFVGPDDMTFKDWFYEKALPFSPAPGVPAPPGGLLDVFFNSFIEGWWPYRHKSNVLMLHFNDMKADHEGTVRKIAAHCGFTPTEEQWPAILEYTSFKWMKAHGDKFQVGTLVPIGPIMMPNTMVRKGAAGKSFEDGMTTEIQKKIHDLVEQSVSDPEARKWMFKGGPIAEPEPGHGEL